MSARIRPISLLAVACSLVALVGPGGALAATPGGVTAFEVPGACYPPRLGAAPGGGVLVRVCSEPEPEAAFGEGFYGSSLIRVPSTAGMESIAVPRAAAGPMILGPDGSIWVGANGAEYGRPGPVSVQRISPGGSVTSYPIVAAGKDQQLRIQALVLGGEGATWAAVGEGDPNDAALGGSVGGELVRVDAAGGVSYFPIPAGIEPQGIALGPDGNLWFTGVTQRDREDHVFHPGTGYIGRMTPAGRLDLFKMPNHHGDPTAIAAAPDGTLWFAETEGGAIGTVGTDGRFGRRLPLWSGASASLAVGPEGDAWIGTRFGLARVTPSGQQTNFPVSADQVTVGAEGDIWALGGFHGRLVQRVVPGAPGIDLRGIRTAVRGRAIRLRLACGGSASGCEGTLDLSMPTIRFHGDHIGKRSVWPGLRFAHLTYAVAPESSRSVTVKLPPAALALAAKRAAHGLSRKVRVEATVAGGPSLLRTLAVPELAQAG